MSPVIRLKRGDEIATGMESNAGTNALDAVAAIMVAVLHAAAGLMDAVLGEKLREIFLPMLVDRLRDEFIGCGN